MDELSLVIVGIDYPNDDKSKSNRRMELMLTAPGEAVELRFDSKNPHDPNAIAVFSNRGVQVGHPPSAHRGSASVCRAKISRPSSSS